jgi:hypothetical protein
VKSAIFAIGFSTLPDDERRALEQPAYDESVALRIFLPMQFAA